jgi:hypothetical protein
LQDVERVLDTIVYDGEAERAVNVVSVQRRGGVVHIEFLWNC